MTAPRQPLGQEPAPGAQPLRAESSVTPPAPKPGTGRSVTPAPSPSMQLARLDLIDKHVSTTGVSETSRALRAVIQERMAQILAGYDAAHDAAHGVNPLVNEAVHRLIPDLTSDTNLTPSWKQRVQAAALLLASLELEADRPEGETIR